MGGGVIKRQGFLTQGKVSLAVLSILNLARFH